MINFILPLGNTGTIANTIAPATERGPLAPIGFIVIGIIVIPVIVLASASIFSSPRNFRVPALFLGSVILFISSIIVLFAIAGALLKFILPQ